MLSYTATHVNPQGSGDTRPTALQIIHNEGLENKLVGKFIVITGAASGIRLETARELSATRATLLLTIDNASFESIRAAAKIILTISDNQINVLVNNTGIMGIENVTSTRDGHEIHFATNHLGHFLLFQLLKPALLSASTLGSQSRVINVASSAHRALDLNESDNYNFQRGGYHYGLAYGTSKPANIYMANEIERRYGHRGLHATSLHPGAINTNLSRHLSSKFVEQIMSDEKILKVLKTLERGAATTVLAAIGKEWENKGGKYLEDCNEARRSKDNNDIFGVGYIRQTYDQKNEERL